MNSSSEKRSGDEASKNPIWQQGPNERTRNNSSNFFGKKMTKEFQIIGSLKGLDDLRVHLEKTALAWSLSQNQLVEINLILEEICSNYIEHGESNALNSIKIQLILENSLLSIRITDEGPEFDPTTVSDPDVHLPIDKRKAGGLGLYFVKHYTDSISYRRINNTNNLFIEKKIK